MISYGAVIANNITLLYFETRQNVVRAVYGDVDASIQLAVNDSILNLTNFSCFLTPYQSTFYCAFL